MSIYPYLAAAAAILSVLFASPLILGSYVVIQRTGGLMQLVWFGFLVLLLGTAVALGALGLFLLVWPVPAA